MSSEKWIIFSALICLRACAEDLSFPPGFLFGAGTSAYQIEGAWNTSGRGESIWDKYIHTRPELVSDTTNGDVACDSYHHWQRDVDIAAEMALDFYRFSVSWTRIVPTGFANEINEDGKNYYNNLINGLLEKGIQPIVTIYHWDMPQRFQDLGGWASPLIVDWYVEYARVLFTLYADRVKIWITINEPFAVCDMGYLNFFAPGLYDLDVAKYLCTRHILLAHAKAWRIYDEEYRPKYHGLISITNHILWPEPLTENEEDAAELAAQQLVGRFSHAIFTEEGGWPPVLQKAVAQKSREEGFPFSRLPDFTQEEIELIKGTFDFYGINYYTSRMVRKKVVGDSRVRNVLDGDNDLDIIFSINPEWKGTANSWFKQHPEGLRHTLQWVKKKYGDVKVFISEVGYSSESDALEDFDRIEFYKSYMRRMLLAMKEDKVNIFGFTAWSLIDNFEWLDGYRAKFGLYSVNFTDPSRRRRAKMSSKFLASVIKNRSLDVPDKYVLE